MESLKQIVSSSFFGGFMFSFCLTQFVGLFPIVIGLADSEANLPSWQILELGTLGLGICLGLIIGALSHSMEGASHSDW